MRDWEQLSTEELFEQGNYAGVVSRNDPDKWQTLAAKGLIGLFDEALTGLERFSDPQINFYKGVIYWLQGDEDTAARILETVNTEHAGNLLALIRKPQIQVLSQLSWTRGGPQDILSGIQADKKFNIKNISFHPNDLPNEPYANIHKYYDRSLPPDFFISEMVEWHITPPNIQELSCPIFGHTNDYDLHIQALYPWMQLFDEFVASDPYEWREVGALINGKPITTFPKFVGVRDNLPPIQDKPRKLDFFISGTVVNPYWPEKTRAIYELLSSMNLEYRLVQNFLPDDFYLGLLMSSKTSFSCIRRPSAMPSRALEAIAMGCNAVVQKESVLRLYLSEEEGVVSYTNEPGSITSAVRRVVEEWETFESRGKKGSELVRSMFSLKKVASQYMRFLTFLAAKPRTQRKKSAWDRLSQKKMTVYRGFIPRDEGVVSALHKANLSFLGRSLSHPHSAHSIIDITREILISAASQKGDIQVNTEKSKLYSIALSMFRKAIRRFESSLVLQFNFLRALYHFGNENEHREAAQIAKDMLQKPIEFWTIDPLEDVLPWDYYGEYFNYRTYFDKVTGHLAKGDDVDDTLKKTILASANYYLARLTNETRHYEEAVVLDPDFARYRLDFAKSISSAPSEELTNQAIEILEDLSAGSVVYEEAFICLENLLLARNKPSMRFEQLQINVYNIMQNQLDADIFFDIFKEIYAEEFRSPLSAPLPKKSFVSSDDRPMISVIVWGDDSVDTVTASLRNLAGQTLSKWMEFFVCHPEIEKDDAVVSRLTNRGCSVHIIKNKKSDTLDSIIADCLPKIQGDYLYLNPPYHYLYPKSLDILLSVLQQESPATLVYGDFFLLSSNRERQIQGEECIGYFRRPGFSRRGLATGLDMSTFSLWRTKDFVRCFQDHQEEVDELLYAMAYRAGLAAPCVHVPKFVGNVVVGNNENIQNKLFPLTEPHKEIRKTYWPQGLGKYPDELPTFSLIPKKFATFSTASELRWLSEWGNLNTTPMKHALFNLSITRELLVSRDFTLAEIVLESLIQGFPKLQTPKLVLSELHKHLSEVNPHESSKNETLKKFESKAVELVETPAPNISSYPPLEEIGNGAQNNKLTFSKTGQGETIK